MAKVAKTLGPFRLLDQSVVQTRLAAELTNTLPSGNVLAQTILALKGAWFVQHLVG